MSYGSLNSVLLEGFMVRNPLLREDADKGKVCKITISNNLYYKNVDGGMEKEVSFFNIEAVGKLADICMEKGRKGRGVRVVGRLSQTRWTGNDGKTHDKVSVVAEHIEYRPESANVVE